MVPDLVYDIGSHDGDDTAYYLYKGYRVVAVDADPTMVEACKRRFADEIRAGKLVILNVGIAAIRGNLRFWLHKQNRPWSSFYRNPEWADEDCDMIEVPCVPFAEIVAEYGVPYYLKIDIENADGLCLRDLNPADLPRYLSFEAGPLSFYGVCFLVTLGYNAFKLIDQTVHNNPKIGYSNEDCLQRWTRELLSWKWSVTRKFNLDTSLLGSIWRATRNIAVLPTAKEKTQRNGWIFGPHSSGPFGNDTPGNWLSLEEAAYNWLHRRFRRPDRGTLNQQSWYDWHVTKIEGYPNWDIFCGVLK
jgi:FkbM family methyltransferase